MQVVCAILECRALLAQLPNKLTLFHCTSSCCMRWGDIKQKRLMPQELFTRFCLIDAIKFAMRDLVEYTVCMYSKIIQLR